MKGAGTHNGRTYSLSEGIDIVCEGIADYLSTSITALKNMYIKYAKYIKLYLVYIL